MKNERNQWFLLVFFFYFDFYSFQKRLSMRLFCKYRPMNDLTLDLVQNACICRRVEFVSLCVCATDSNSTMKIYLDLCHRSLDRPKKELFMEMVNALIWNGSDQIATVDFDDESTFHRLIRMNFKIFYMFTHMFVSLFKSGWLATELCDGIPNNSLVFFFHIFAFHMKKKRKSYEIYHLFLFLWFSFI